MNKIPVILGAAFYAEPVSIKDSDIFNYYDVEELNISNDLKLAIKLWDDEYQATFDEEYPPDSNFATLDLAEAHKKRGADLAKRLQDELGEGYFVEYKP